MVAFELFESFIATLPTLITPDLAEFITRKYYLSFSV